MAIDSKLTLVCGGGGVWGVAWMSGIAMGLAESGVDLRRATAMIGTSAGSVVSTQLACGGPIEEMFERQVNPERQPREVAPPPSSLGGLIEFMQRKWASDDERLQALCRLALDTQTFSPEQRRKDIGERLGIGEAEWPQLPLYLTAVDADTSQLCVHDAGSGIPLIDAVSASCAVPGVWPPTVVNGRRFIDGGVWRGPDNLHLANGSHAVLLLSPMGNAARPGDPVMADDLARLREAGTQVLVIGAGPEALEAMGTNALDPATRKPAAEAGRRQALQIASEVSQFTGAAFG